MSIKVNKDNYQESNEIKLDPNISDTDKKVISKRDKITNFLVGIVNSRVFRATVLATCGTIFALVVLSSPPGWVIAAIATGLFIVGLFVFPSTAKQELEFEISSLIRMAKGRNYHQIQIESKEGYGKLFLGAIPNSLTDKKKLIKKEHIGAVLSVNEPWERKPFGLSNPYGDEDWKTADIAYKKLDAQDHKLLPIEKLEVAADFIEKQLAAGKNVYVHCRAGVGRSAMAIAAYLIKYEGKTTEQAAKIIKDSRPCSTIGKKVDGLKKFELYLQNKKKNN